MKKSFYFIILLLCASVIYAEETESVTISQEAGNIEFVSPQQKQSAASETKTESGKHKNSQEENFFTRFKFGIGADFSGTAGMLPGYTYAYFLKNQLGVSAGFDFNWLVFKKESGRGEGNLYLGFGFDFQYWIPTTWINRTNNPRYLYDDYYDDEDTIDFHILIHHMRIPVTLNLAYELKAGIGALKSIEPRISLGINSNIFKFGYGSSDEEYAEKLSEDIKAWNHRIYNYKISGTWALGLSFVFTNNWFFSTSIGGDFGSSHYKSDLFYERPYERDDAGNRTDKVKEEWRGRFLYGHHEFMMFETGYRF
jgi:hypothetical protein